MSDSTSYNYKDWMQTAKVNYEVTPEQSAELDALASKLRDRCAELNVPTVCIVSHGCTDEGYDISHSSYLPAEVTPLELLIASASVTQGIDMAVSVYMAIVHETSSGPGEPTGLILH